MIISLLAVIILGSTSLYWREKYRTLCCRVDELYYGNRWDCDALSDQEQARLWEKVRDAANFKPGETVKRGG